MKTLISANLCRKQCRFLNVWYILERDESLYQTTKQTRTWNNSFYGVNMSATTSTIASSVSLITLLRDEAAILPVKGDERYTFSHISDISQNVSKVTITISFVKITYEISYIILSVALFSHQNCTYYVSNVWS